jgi:hypothetical protein
MSRPPCGMEGTVALVTGGGTGIGFARVPGSRCRHAGRFGLQPQGLVGGRGPLAVTRRR